MFQAIVYNTHVDESEHLALIKGKISPKEETLVRVHTKYVPGDVFGFELLNTGAVIQRSMEIIAKAGKGVILYLQPKIKAHHPAMVAYPKVEGKQQKGMNASFVYQADFKEYGIGAQILRDLGVRKMRLLTNNKKHLVGLRGYGLEVTSLVPIPSDNPLRDTAKQPQDQSQTCLERMNLQFEFRAQRELCRSSNTTAAAATSSSRPSSYRRGKKSAVPNATARRSTSNCQSLAHRQRAATASQTAAPAPARRKPAAATSSGQANLPTKLFAISLRGRRKNLSSIRHPRSSVWQIGNNRAAASPYDQLTTRNLPMESYSSINRDGCA